MAKKLQPVTTLHVDQFYVPVRLAESFVCGNEDRSEFSVLFEASARGLDESGFVYEVKNLIQGVKDDFDADGAMLKASCEELAGGVVHSIHERLEDRLVSVSVTVLNQTGGVTVVWEDGEAVPAFPRLATTEEYESTLAEERHGAPRAKSGC